MSQQVVTIRRAGAQCASFKVKNSFFTVPVWTVAVYEAKPRKADGKLTWRYVISIGATRSACRPSMRLCDEARLVAAERGLSYVPGIRHGQPVKAASCRQVAGSPTPVVEDEATGG